VSDLNDLLFVNGHPGLEKFINIVDIAAQGFEVMKDGVPQL
jgi:hypothetical protein